MAYPIINSPTFPSVADLPASPPTLEQMPVFNPGTHTYLCEDGVTRVLTEEQAINMGISCKVVDRTELSGPALPSGPGPDPNATVAQGPLFSGPRFRAINLGDRRVVRRI